MPEPKGFSAAGATVQLRSLLFCRSFQSTPQYPISGLCGFQLSSSHLQIDFEVYMMALFSVLNNFTLPLATRFFWSILRVLGSMATLANWLSSFTVIMTANLLLNWSSAVLLFAGTLMR